MKIDLEKTCCFTGHRPQFCEHSEAEIKEKLAEKINLAIEDGYTTFITGMACGVDIWAAEIIIDLMKENDQLQLVCAVPFKGMENRFSPEWQERYRNVLDYASNISYICPRHNSWCYKARNQWMVDHSSRVIAVYNGKSGGTKQTIKYAKDNDREVVLLNDSRKLKPLYQEKGPIYYTSVNGQPYRSNPVGTTPPEVLEKNRKEMEAFLKLPEEERKKILVKELFEDDWENSELYEDAWKRPSEKSQEEDLQNTKQGSLSKDTENNMELRKRLDKVIEETREWGKGIIELLEESRKPYEKEDE